jgi:hypothetical protein
MVDKFGVGRQNHSLRSFILAPIPQSHIQRKQAGQDNFGL